MTEGTGAFGGCSRGGRFASARWGQPPLKTHKKGLTLTIDRMIIGRVYRQRRPMSCSVKDDRVLEISSGTLG